MERWRNKVAIVTGASSGIGAACARALLSHGLIVVALARRLNLMETEIKAKLPEDQQRCYFPMFCNLCDEASIKNVISWADSNFGRIDILINNAGIFREDVQIVSRNNSSDLKAVFNVNVMAVALCTREVFQSMKRRNVDGHVIVLNGTLGLWIPPLPVDVNLYPSSKFAVSAMVEVLRQEFLQYQTKIKITSISPSTVDSSVFGNLNDYPVDLPALKADDVADAVIFALQTPPHVQIRELTIQPLGAMF